jgi:hypothetical protein
MDMQFLRFYMLLNLQVVGWLYEFFSPVKVKGYHTWSIRKLDFQDRFDILLEMRLSGVVEQGYTKLYGKSQINKSIVSDGM